MPDFTPGQQKLLGYFGIIQQAVDSRLSTADLWSAVKSAMVAEGVEPGPFGFQDMNVIRGMAADMRNAGDAFARAPGGDVIDSRMVARAPWSRGLMVESLVPAYEVRFEHHIIADDVETTVWRTLQIDGPLPSTVGELRDMVESFGQELADTAESPPLFEGPGGLTPAESVLHLGTGEIRIAVLK